MSQPCTAIDLLLIDVRALESGQTKEAVTLANELAIACGCLSLEADVASAVALLNMPEAFDFWFGGDGSSLPFQRALGFMTIVSPRVLLISDDPRARSEAEAVGIQVVGSTTVNLERMLG